MTCQMMSDRHMEAPVSVSGSESVPFTASALENINNHPEKVGNGSPCQDRDQGRIKNNFFRDQDRDRDYNFGQHAGSGSEIEKKARDTTFGNGIGIGPALGNGTIYSNPV